jgi:hypothetical protein
MRRSWLGLMIATILASVTWMACVGDEPSTAIGNDEAGGPGSLDNACFGNGTCNSGLSCVSDVCVDLDGAIGGGDSSTTECDAGVPFSDPAHLPCPHPADVCSANDGGIQCCAQPGSPICQVSGTSCNQTSGAVIKCILPTHCNAATSLCCVAALNSTADFFDDTCPRTANINQGTCEPFCATGERATCITNSDCASIPGTSCRPYRTSYNGNPAVADAFSVGLCVPD